MSLQSEILSILKMLSPSDSTMGKIRIGNNGDGGYVLPNDLEKIENVLSIGIGNEDSFDLHFAKNNIPVFQYDHTVESAVSEHELYQFNKIAWATADSSQTRTLTTMVKIHGLDKTITVY